MKSLARNLFDLPFVRIIRNGLLMLIPVLTVGSIALILRSLPLDPYQTFIQSFCSGILYSVFSVVYNATFGLLSVYMVVFLSHCTASQQLHGNDSFGAISAGVASFLISVGFLSDAFVLSSLGPVGMFTAILCGTLAPMLYIRLTKRIDRSKVFFDGAEPVYNMAIGVIVPLSAVCAVFALTNFLIDTLLHVGNFWQLFSILVNRLFSAVGLNFMGGLLYILLSSIMWFFGIHGSDVLESVTSGLLTPAMEANVNAVAAGLAPTQIYTKTFFDVFVLMGGCGSALALLIALLLFSKRKSSRSLARLAAFPMLFNINELMVFGLPIVYNPILFIPFILAPLASFLTSAAAMSIGLVPLTTEAVAWTTPVLLGGYQSTGSLAGAVLQLVNLFVCTMIYMPFVRRYDRVKEQESKANIDLLIERFKACETDNRNVLLTEESGILGSIAKQLVNDLRGAIDTDELYMLYQPQSNASGDCIGAEALLRWKHPLFGLIYPPLVIKLANEGGFLPELERAVFRAVRRDVQAYDMRHRISINVTASTLQESGFIEFLTSTFPDARVGEVQICIEITEQTELVTNNAIIGLFEVLHENGFRLAIDDFSMGFTSLKYLQECRFDEVKLDGSLVRGMMDNTSARDIISSIVFLSESLGFSVLAEFVETKEQQERLEEIGCREYQGYLFSRPITPEAFIAYCKQLCTQSDEDTHSI